MQSRIIKLTLAYIGTRYIGWQIQPKGPSIQGTVQRCLKNILKESIVLTGAGRTDAGVHALGQIAHFQTMSLLPTHAIGALLNQQLPEDISVRAVESMPSEFHARYDAKSKLYRYIIDNTRILSPFSRHRSWHIPHTLNISAMQQAAKLLIGEHDFASFQASGCSARHAVRTLYDISITPELSVIGCETNSLMECSFHGNGFVRHMIRNMVGTIVDIGLGRIAVENIQTILQAKQRVAAGKCAPACGLYMCEVYY